MSFDWTTIEQEAQKEINQASFGEAIEALRIKYLGRQGLLAEITVSISSLSASERPEFGKKANYLKNKLTQLLEERVSQLKENESQGLEAFDITLPGEPIPQAGTLHPITQTIQEITAIFSKLGFVTVEGPEVENEYNNFSGLNIPLDHPSRDAFDTFYIKSPGHQVIRSPERFLLRSHTSPVQIRVMKERKPPLAVIVPGKVYRPDAVDASHSFVFHQIEGFLVDQAVSFADLKGTLTAFAQRLFGEKIQMRFRPHFFPFTEPSAEVDVSCILCKRNQKPETSNQKNKCSVCGGKGWLEILGCGMIHPNVFANVGYPKDKYSGFAFGMGIERIAMLKYGINDIRLFFENDLRFLRQF